MADLNLPKDSIQCLVCDNKIGVSTRNSVRIFDDSSYTLSEKPLVDVISAVLKTDINKESVHSLIICKKCFKLFNEVKSNDVIFHDTIFLYTKFMIQIDQKLHFPSYDLGG